MSDDIPVIAASGAAELCCSLFQGAIEFLRPGLPYAPNGPLRAAAETVRRLAESPWRLDTTKPIGFHLDATQATLSIAFAELGGMAAEVINRCCSDPDMQTRRALASVATVRDVRSFLAASLLELFLAHEFIHVSQRLGSMEYEDSDGYIRAVAAVDYQADISSIFYVFSRQRLEYQEVPGRELLLLLMLVHIAAMQHFSPATDGRVQRASFERIMIWHWQAARVAAGPSEPDPSHPSLLNMPVICLPEADGLGADLARPDPSALRNEAIVSRQDVVVAFHCSSGSIKMFRLRSTSADRVSAMIGAVFDKDFSAFRSNVGEVFSAHSESVSNRVFNVPASGVAG